MRRRFNPARNAALIAALFSDGEKASGDAAPGMRKSAKSPISGASREMAALLLVREKGIVARRELLGLGLSRYMIALLCRRGVLRQVRMGVYRLTPETEAQLED